jgi:hypothetical protein
MVELVTNMQLQVYTIIIFSASQGVLKKYPTFWLHGARMPEKYI